LIAFWVAAVSLTLVVVVALAVPLAGRARAEPQREHDRSNVALYQDQLRELERDRDLGLLTPEGFDEARNELGRRLLADVTDASPDASGSPLVRRGAWRYVALACVPVSAVLAYLAIGTPQALEPGMVQRAAPGEPADQERNLERLTERLAARLEANPQDAEAWVLLARSYQMLGRAEASAKAFSRAIELVPNSAQLLADYADTLVASAGGTWTDDAKKAVAQALKLDGAHPKALWLAGTEAYARKDYKVTLGYWEKLLPMAEAGSEVARMIENNIAEVRGLLGMPPLAAQTPAPKPSAAPAAPQSALAAAGKAVSGTIALDPALASKVQGGESVFVFVRAAQGPKMPLAIRRIRVQDLPYKFALDDSAAMAPGMVISAFEQVVVGARISRSGDAAPKAGDLEGYSAPVKPGTSGIEVKIHAEVR